MKEAPRLGRGLPSLLGDALNPSPSSSTVGSTAVADLEPNPFQPRGAISTEDLVELAASIREQGLLQPILIRRHPSTPGRFQIIAGERRWRAAQMAGLTTIPSFLRDLPDTAASAAALVENLQRENLNPIEEAEGFKRLVDGFGLTQDELAQTIGKSRSYVANTLRLLQLPEETVGLVRRGLLSAGHARAALACENPAEAAQLIVDRGLTVRQAEALARQPARHQTPKRPVVAQLERGTADLRAVEADLSEQLGLAVSISFNGQGGTLSLRYQTLDQLDHLVGKLGRV